MDKYVTLFIGLENFNYFLMVACATLKDQVNFFVYKNHREVNMVYTIQVKFGSMIPEHSAYFVTLMQPMSTAMHNFAYSDLHVVSEKDGDSHLNHYHNTKEILFTFIHIFKL